jgi:hypothetical protein
MENEIVPVGEVRYDLSIARAPNQVLAEAQEAAKSLQSVIANRKNAVKFNGKHYLSFEDWQTCGRFYGVTAKIVSTEPVDMDGVKGFIARAEAINTQTGQVVSAAESMCMNDEPNWAKKPLFQLRSMAQTRAAAKSLRNVLAWVVVLAGYEPNVAEEMTGDEGSPKHEPIQPPKPKAAPAGNSVTFVPAHVSKKDGEGAKGPWTKYGVKSPDGDWYGTFDADFGEAALLAYEKKQPVTIVFEVDGQFKNIKTLTA